MGTWEKKKTAQNKTKQKTTNKKRRQSCLPANACNFKSAEPLLLLYGSRAVVASLHPCQMVVIQFEISRATDDTHRTRSVAAAVKGQFHISVSLSHKDWRNYSTLQMRGGW